METINFLKHVLPDSGDYCIAKMNAVTKMHQKFFNTIDDASLYALKKRENFHVFFGLASFKSGEQKRTKANAVRHKALFLDLDCGENKDFPDQITALKSLKSFCETLSLAKPTIVDSGNGLHIYWTFTQEVDNKAWLETAECLKKACETNQFPADPVVTADSARLLRLPGSFNIKTDPPKQVKIIHMGEDNEFNDLKNLLITYKTSNNKVSYNHALSKTTSALMGTLLENSENKKLIEDLLNQCSPDCSRSDWCKICWSVLSLGWECCKDLIERWSMNSDKFNQDDFDQIVGDFDLSKGITIGTLHHFASENDAKKTPREPQKPQPHPQSMPANQLWHVPEPLFEEKNAREYPLVDMPIEIQSAINEVQSFTQAPLPIVASSALSSLSISCQGLANVKRTNNLVGPVSLFFFTVAESGERKSSSDNYFSNVIREYESETQSAKQTDIQRYKAAHDAWEAKKAGIKQKITNEAKNNKPTSSLEELLLSHEMAKPVQPKVPKVLYADASPEALGYGLSVRWPSAGIISSEAGTVLGSHAMGSEVITRNLALYNQAWDGTNINVDRKSTSSYQIRQPRFTMSLQVQPATLANFLKNAGELPRGIGFFARCLISEPESTQGTRFFREAPKLMPALSKFNQRIRVILNETSTNSDGLLELTTLKFDEAAQDAWIMEHDHIESELGLSGRYSEIKDIASKAADNISRIAALFQIYESGTKKDISLDNLQSAISLVKWHLDEALRFILKSNFSQTTDTNKLDKWLIDYCLKKNVNNLKISDLQKCGPNSLRRADKLEPILEELAMKQRIKIDSEGKKLIQVNPFLLESNA